MEQSPAFISKQPFGSVPLMVDGDLVLFESRAICRYLELKYPDQGTRLIPKDLIAQVKFEQAASIEHSQFDPTAAAINFERRLKR